MHKAGSLKTSAMKMIATTRESAAIAADDCELEYRRGLSDRIAHLMQVHEYIRDTGTDVKLRDWGQSEHSTLLLMLTRESVRAMDEIKNIEFDLGKCLSQLTRDHAVCLAHSKRTAASSLERNEQTINAGGRHIAGSRVERPNRSNAVDYPGRCVAVREIGRR